MSAQNTETLRKTLDSVLARLLDATGASRVTLRLDDDAHGFQMGDVVAEAIAPGELSMRGIGGINHRAAGTGVWLEKHRTLLVQDDFGSEPEAPQMLRQHFQVKAQMLAPVIRDGRLDGWLSVHEAKSPRRWREEDKAAITRTAQTVIAELAKAP